jgi:hypothetical protein
MDCVCSNSESSSGYSDDDDDFKSDDGDDSESDERPKPVRKCLVKAVKKRTGRSSKSTKMYSGAPIRLSKAIKNSLPFQAACHKLDHTKGWSDSMTATRPCPNRCLLMDLLDMYVCRFGSYARSASMLFLYRSCASTCIDAKGSELACSIKLITNL